MNSIISICNEKLLNALANYLNFNSTNITKSEIYNLQKACNLKEENAFQILLAEKCGFNFDNSLEDKLIYKNYMPNCVKKLKVENYSNNAYYNQIKIPQIFLNNWNLGFKKYKAYEAFVCNDIVAGKNGELFPQIGYFTKDFKYPCVFENNREWMLITPNEINTMQESINNSFGNVLTFGLGLGYFAFMAGMKKEVKSITIIERDKCVIELFNKYILPQFNYFKNKIKIIEADAYEYAENEMANKNYNFVFVDIWRDVSDGIDAYLKFKNYEKLLPKTVFNYWIEKSILFYV